MRVHNSQRRAPTTPDPVTRSSRCGRRPKPIPVFSLSVNHLLPMIQGTMAFTDLFQVPLVLAIVYSIVLSRRWGRAWKGIGVASAGYAMWVVATAFLVGFSPSGYLLLTLGTLLDSVEPMWKATSSSRIWAIGVVATFLLFWMLPTGVAWLLRRRQSSAPRARSAPWTTLGIAGLLLLAGQQLLLAYARRGDGRMPAMMPGDPLQVRDSMLSGIALALTLPIAILFVTAVARWLQRATRPARGGSDVSS